VIGTNTIDPGMEIDWGKTSADYANYRPGPPISLYEKLKAQRQIFQKSRY